jgi:1,4-alpha-glucan branching enzyme
MAHEPNKDDATGGAKHPLVPVTFVTSADGATTVALVGEFNGWSTDAAMMTPAGDEFEITIQLEPGRSYRYKFLVNGHAWEDDPAADGYVDNDFGGTDSVRDV